MEIKLKNLCPHDVNIKDVNGKVWCIKPEPLPARVETDFKPMFYLGTVGVFKRQYILTTNLPPTTEGVMYIVSRQVASYNIGRKDLLVPSKTFTEGDVTYCYGLEIL